MKTMELLVRIVDNGNAEGGSKRGDVIDVHPAGWEWSEAELTYPSWRIIKTELLQSHVDILMQGWDGNSLNSPLFRYWFIDFSKLPNPELYEGTRGCTIELPHDTLLAAILKKVV